MSVLIKFQQFYRRPILLLYRILLARAGVDSRRQLSNEWN